MRFMIVPIRKLMFLILVALLVAPAACQSPLQPEATVATADQPELNPVQPTDVPTPTPTEAAEMPTKTGIPPTVTPQPTPVPPTETPLPSPTPEPPKITTVPELVGYWEYNGFQTNAGGALHYIYRFRADGILEIGDSRRAIESGDIKARVDYWFEEGEWRSQLVSGFWRDDTCFLGTGKPLTGRYEIRPNEAGDLQFFRMIDSCQRRSSLSGNDAILTPILVEDMEWFMDADTGLPLNPDGLTGNDHFVLVGTMLSFEAGEEALPFVTVRLPTGQVVNITGPPLPDILIEGGSDLDLDGYDPDYPLRVRVVVQQSGNDLVAEEMIVFTELK